MKVRLKGLHSATKRLADGTARTYWYAWRGGPRIDAEPGSPEFVAAYAEAHGRRRAPAPGTLKALIALYRSTAEFLDRAPATRRDYARYLAMIEEEFGTMPLAAIEHRKARGVFKGWRDRMAATPRKADMAWAVLARVLSVAKDRGEIEVNPCERGGRLYRPDRTDAIWTDGMIERFNATASAPLRLAMLAALWTGQRQGDLLTMTWAAFDGERIRLKQGKGGARVSIRAGEPLRAALAALKRGKAVQILTNSDGDPWTASGFRASWRKACARAGVVGVTFHDLRGTAVTNLALVGCSVPEIAALTGHGLDDVEAILRAHYLGRDQRLADAAIARLEGANRERVLQTGDKPSPESKG